MSTISRKHRTGRKFATLAGKSRNKKVIVEFPPELLRETNRAVQELAINRSQLIRSALQIYLDRLKDEKLEHELAESLSANADLDRRILKEFRHVDAQMDF